MVKLSEPIRGTEKECLDIFQTMCYIQLSLLGCAGYICIADTLSNPMIGSALFPVEGKEQELWYTPMFYSDIWTWRRLFYSMGNRCGISEKTVDKKQFYMFFDFDKEAAI